MADKPSLPGSIPWAEETLAWFDDWRSSPRTDPWDMPQWQYLFDTAIVHSAVYSGDMAQLPELHKRLAYMGLAFDAAPAAAREERKATTLELVQGRCAQRRAAASC